MLFRCFLVDGPGAAASSFRLFFLAAVDNGSSSDELPFDASGAEDSWSESSTGSFVLPDLVEVVVSWSESSTGSFVLRDLEVAVSLEAGAVIELATGEVARLPVEDLASDKEDSALLESVSPRSSHTARFDLVATALTGLFGNGVGVAGVAGVAGLLSAAAPVFEDCPPSWAILAAEFFPTSCVSDV